MHYEFQIVRADAPESAFGPITAEHLHELSVHRIHAEQTPDDHGLRILAEAVDGSLLYVATFSVVDGERRAVFCEERIRASRKGGVTKLVWNTHNDAYSTQAGHPFHGKLDSHSTRSWTVEAQ